MTYWYKVIIIIIVIVIVSNGNRTEWSTIQGVIGRVISNRPSPITPELYDTKSYYQLIVPITKCKNLSLGIFINVRNRFQSKFLFQLKLDSLPGHNCFIDFDWLSCAM